MCGRRWASLGRFASRAGEALNAVSPAHTLETARALLCEHQWRRSDAVDGSPVSAQLLFVEMRSSSERLAQIAAVGRTERAVAACARSHWCVLATKCVRNNDAFACAAPQYSIARASSTALRDARCESGSHSCREGGTPRSENILTADLPVVLGDPERSRCRRRARLRDDDLVVVFLCCAHSHSIYESDASRVSRSHTHEHARVAHTLKCSLGPQLADSLTHEPLKETLA